MDQGETMSSEQGASYAGFMREFTQSLARALTHAQAQTHERELLYAAISSCQKLLEARQCSV